MNDIGAVRGTEFAMIDLLISGEAEEGGTIQPCDQPLVGLAITAQPDRGIAADRPRPQHLAGRASANTRPTNLVSGKSHHWPPLDHCGTQLKCNSFLLAELNSATHAASSSRRNSSGPPCRC